MKKPNTPNVRADLAAAIALSHQKVHRAVAARILELSDGGLSDVEVAHITGYPLHLVRVVLRGGNPAFSRPKFETRLDRSSLPSLRLRVEKR